jgi:hypothetical protein
MQTSVHTSAYTSVLTAVLFRFIYATSILGERAENDSRRA